MGNQEECLFSALTSLPENSADQLLLFVRTNDISKLQEEIKNSCFSFHMSNIMFQLLSEKFMRLVFFFKFY